MCVLVCTLVYMNVQVGVCAYMGVYVCICAYMGVYVCLYVYILVTANGITKDFGRLQLDATM